MTAAHHAVLTMMALVLGSCIGSFLNVCGYRIPRGLSLVRPASRCPGCGSAIRARDNLPVLGWLLLGGRCRDCGCRISPVYPLVEAAVGLLFALDYIVRVVVPRGDVWETIGPGGVLVRLLTDEVLISLVVVALLIARDRQRADGRSSLHWPRWARIGRQKQALARSEPAVLP
jgi:leader peptidase (prepilin peptidase)/N-methyltransferase